MNMCSQKFRPQDRVALCSEAEISFVDLHQVIPVLLEQFSAAENLVTEFIFEAFVSRRVNNGDRCCVR